MILPMHDKPTIIQVTTEWLLLHQPNRHKCHAVTDYRQPKRIRLLGALREYLKEPRSLTDMVKYTGASSSTVMSLLSNLPIKCIKKPSRGKKGMWQLCE